MRSLSESLANTFKCKLQESDIDVQSIQKVLRLFGYPNATDQRYICCLSIEPRTDVHKYRIGTRMFIMCIVTSGKKVIDSALWSLPQTVWETLSNASLHSCKDVDSIDAKLDELSEHKYTFVMRYKPS